MTRERQDEPTTSVRTGPRIVVEAMVVLAGIALLLWAWRADAHWFERHFQESRCVRDARSLRAVVVWRALAVGASAVLLIVVRPLLGRFAGRRSPTALLASFARVAVAMVLALGTSELILRWKMGRVVPWGPHDFLPAVRSSAVYCWSLEPSRSMTVRSGGRDVVYAVNAEGARASRQNDEPDLKAPTILFAGESMVFGLALPYEETFPALVGKDLGIQAVNFGVHGYGGDQTYLRMLEYLPRFERVLAVVTIVLPEQIGRNVHEQRRRLGLGKDGALELVEPPPEWIRDLRTRTLLQTLVPYHSDEGIDLERVLLRETARVVRARGAMPVFLVTNFGTPCMAVAGQEPWIWRTLFDGQDLPRVSVDLDPTWVISDDPHPDARAHRKIAAALEDALRTAHLAGL